MHCQRPFNHTFESKLVQMQADSKTQKKHDSTPHTPTCTHTWTHTYTHESWRIQQQHPSSTKNIISVSPTQGARPLTEIQVQPPLSPHDAHAPMLFAQVRFRSCRSLSLHSRSCFAKLLALHEHYMPDLSSLQI